MKAYKFLEGGRGVYSHAPWPLPGRDGPGSWVTVHGELVPCRNGIHACAPEDLPYWIAGELWEIELAGAIVAVRNGLLARSGRLLRRVEAWSLGGAMRFAAACSERALRTVEGDTQASATARGFAADAVTCAAKGSEAIAAYCAAMASATLRDPEGSQAAFEAERQWQGRWLAQELELTALAPGEPSSPEAHPAAARAPSSSERA